ncbi:hypothetical protein [Rhodococcus globerulus]|uniref:Uncharacterized protein n=1 Tax=Rhodococcus globerulus TaxID=33008 RepID=A0ABU4C527_RHOGO|nr:hypothetical protein [Rhodococcus globerulus]MDV6271519.1 hypothetical protein [Rhodococcus globerulus]
MAQSEQAREVARRLGVVSDPSPEQLAEAVALFAPLGWAMCGHWHLEGTLRVLRESGNGASDAELDEAIADVWNTENVTWLKHAATPIRRWSNSHYPFKQLLWDRVRLIEKAIEHHFNGAYEASIPIILAQIDGLNCDLTGQSFFSKGNRDPYLDDETIAGMEANLPVVRALSEDVRPTGDYGKLSRHGVLHGRDLGYATRVNSTKTIVLIAALGEYLPKVANDAGAQLRREHVDNVGGSGELDELGRFVDDRQVPELLNFAYNLDTEYLNAVLLNPGPFDASRKLAAVARKHGLDSEAFAFEEDQIGWRWYYTIPAGQTLGYAARPTTSAKRRHPDVWRSDRSSVSRTGVGWFQTAVLGFDLW